MRRAAGVWAGWFLHPTATQVFSRTEQAIASTTRHSLINVQFDEYMAEHIEIRAHKNSICHIYILLEFLSRDEQMVRLQKSRYGWRGIVTPTQPIRHISPEPGLSAYRKKDIDGGYQNGPGKCPHESVISHNRLVL